MTKRLHIVTFTNAKDSFSGSATDIYHKLETLYRAGVRIHLHCFESTFQQKQHLEKLCEQIYYYPFNQGLAERFSVLPAIVKGRNYPELIKNLHKHTAPVLFEGLESCYLLDDPLLHAFPKFVRTHSIEHLHYFDLFRTSVLPQQRLFYLFESYKLKLFESKLKCADHILATSLTETEYWAGKYGHCHFVPPFHSFSRITCQPGTGDYLLFHGNLEMLENQRAVKYLVNTVFSEITESFVIAGKNPPEWLLQKATKTPHITVISNPSAERMNQLIANAQVCLIPSFQPAGMKLKLLNSLYSGRHCLTNSFMVKGTDLKNLCHIADSPTEMIGKIRFLMELEFGEDEITKRKLILETLYANELNAQKIIELL